MKNVLTQSGRRVLIGKGSLEWARCYSSFVVSCFMCSCVCIAYKHMCIIFAYVWLSLSVKICVEARFVMIVSLYCSPLYYPRQSFLLMPAHPDHFCLGISFLPPKDLAGK